MDLTAEFLIYAALFRLAIIGAGVSSIVLGYKLFVRGVMPDGHTDGELSAGDIKLTIKNAAPGTCFALFGAVMIGVMVVQGDPELLTSRRASDGTDERVTSGSASDEAGQNTSGDSGAGGSAGSGNGSGGSEERVMIRGEQQGGTAKVEQKDGEGFQDYIKEILGGSDDVAAAIKQQQESLKPGETLADAAIPLSHLAALYLAESGPIDERLAGKALSLAKVVEQIDPDDAGNLATIAWAEWYLGDRDSAETAMSKAAKGDARFAADLAEIKNGSQ